MRLTANDPEGWTDLMGAKGMDELGAAGLDDMLNGGYLFGALFKSKDSYLKVRADPSHANLISGLGNYPRPRALFPMSLILTIFALVFVTELVSWIGKSVFLQFVHILAVRGWLP